LKNWAIIGIFGTIYLYINKKVYIMLDYTIYNRYHVLLYRVLVTILNSEDRRMRSREISEALERPACEMTGMLQGYTKYHYLRREKSRDPVTGMKSYEYSVTAYGKEKYAKMHQRILRGEELNGKTKNPAKVDRYINAFFADNADTEVIKKVINELDIQFRALKVTQPINYGVND